MSEGIVFHYGDKELSYTKCAHTEMFYSIRRNLNLHTVVTFIL